MTPPIQLDRPLTRRQALTCEGSATQRCRCRCGGNLHGSKRSALPEYFEKLPQADPHWIPEKSRQLRLPRPVGAP